MAGWVYVVDDDDAIRGVIVDVLRDEGYQVDSASRGAAALDYLRTCGARQPDVILLDLLMPALHGRDFVTTYRQLPVPHAPVIAITAARDAEVRAAQVGADGLLLKPFAVGDLLQGVERHLRRTPAAAGPAPAADAIGQPA
jgi:DNA-binding response OmpR family regulator